MGTASRHSHEGASQDGAPTHTQTQDQNQNQTREDPMSRRNFDIIIATGGALVALLVLALGVVARNEATFAKRTVTEQLEAQQIFFKDAEKLTDREKTAPGVERYAGQQLTTGQQAQAFAGYIGVHLAEQAEKAGYPGATYASIGTVQTELRTQAAQAATTHLVLQRPF